MTKKKEQRKKEDSSYVNPGVEVLRSITPLNSSDYVNPGKKSE